MSSQNSDSLHEAVGQALRAGDFQNARHLIVDLGAAVRLELAAASPADQVALFKGKIGRLQDHLSLARVMRAHLASRLQSNTAVCLYQQQESGRGHSWRLEA